MTETYEDWTMEKFPLLQSLCELTPEAKARRKSMFREIDNGNGLVSLAELDKAMRDVLATDSDVIDIYDAKPAIMRAFQASKDERPSKRGELGDDYIELGEFRFFILSLISSLRYYMRFNKMDKNQDKRISLVEFADAVNGSPSVDDAEETFKKMDTNGGGFILYDEWCKFNMENDAMFAFLD